MSRRNLLSALFVSAMAITLVSCNSGGTSTTSPIDLSPPVAPTNVHASSDAAIQRDWLLWDPSASASVVGYEVYVSSSATVNGSMIASVDASTSSLMLPIVGQATTEFYRVRAVGSNTVKSAFSSPFSFDRTTWDGPNGPTGGPGKDSQGDF